GALSSFQIEAAADGAAFDLQVAIAAQNHGVRPRQRRDFASVSLIDQRSQSTVVEAKIKNGAHPHLAALAPHDTHDIRRLAPWQHQVDQLDLAFLRYEAAFKDQGVAAIAPVCALDLGAGCKPPEAVLCVAEQGGEACAGIETRPAEP